MTTEDLISTFIVNQLGINLCSVKSINVDRQEDGQIKEIKIEFITAKEELIDMIKAVPIRYERYTAELSPLIEWDFDMNGPTRYYWHTNLLREKSEEELHEFYKKLRNGDFYDPIPEITEYKAVTLPRYQKTVS